MSKPTRLFEIIQLLRAAKRPMTAQQIGEALEVSKRTAYRDIAALQTMRIPIDGEAGIGYIMRPGFDLPPLAFDSEEVEAIVVGLALLGRTGDKGLLRAASKAAAKISTALPDDTKSSFDQDALHVSSWNIVPDASIDTGMLRRAIREEEKLEISYQKPGSEISDRTILPLAITYHVDVIVLAAWCELRMDYRHFRVDRIEHCRPTGEYFRSTGYKMRADWQLLQAMQGEYNTATSMKSMLPYPMLTEPGIRQFMIDSDQCYPPDAVDLSIEQQRETYNRLCEHFRKVPPDDIQTKDMSVTHGEWDIPVRHYAPKSGSDLPVMLYLHGGGFVVGNLESHDDICAEISSKANISVIAVDYRLAPEHPFPMPFDDCLAVLNHLSALGIQLGFDATRLVIGGDSAGGNLAAALCIAARDTDGPIISGQVLIYPELGGDLSKGSYASQANAPGLSTSDIAYYRTIYAGPPNSPNHNNKLALPLQETDYTKLPPAFLVAAHFDPLHDDCLDFAANLNNAGVAAMVRDEPLLVHSFLRARHMSDAAATSFKAICAMIHSLAYEAALPGAD